MPLSQRKHGYWGTPLGMFSVVEETGKGAHHLHAAVWCGAMPGLCTGAAHDKETFEALAHELDTQYCAELPLATHIVDSARKAMYVRMHRVEYDEPTSRADYDEPEPEPTAASVDGDVQVLDVDECQPADVDMDELPLYRGSPLNRFMATLRRGAQITAAAKQMHVHTQTCHKEPQGTYACRMANPNGHPVAHTRAVDVTMICTSKVAEAGGLSTEKFSEYMLPPDQLTCGEADAAAPWWLRTCQGCWPLRAGEHSVLSSGDIWLQVADPQRAEHAVRKKAQEDEAAQTLLMLGVDNDHALDDGDQSDDMAEDVPAPSLGLARLVPRDDRGSIVIELKRPTLEWPEPEVAAEMRKASKLKGEELKTAYESIKSGMPDAVRAELEVELEQPEWSEVKARLESLTEHEMQRLIKEWSELRCANARLTCFSPILTAILKCNTAPYLLGARESSRAACFYLVKYMTKDCVALSASLSTLVDVKRHIEKWESTADDSGSSERTAKHFLQRACNSYQAEVHDTQAASLLLNYPASMTSERFVFLAGWDYVRFALELVGQDANTWDVRAEAAPEGIGGDDDEEDDDIEQIGQDSAWTREQKEEAYDGMGQPGTLKTWFDKDGLAVAVSSTEHYCFRGPELARFSPQEYGACVTVEAKTDEEKEEYCANKEAGREEMAERARVGRRPNAKVRTAASDPRIHPT